ncbi:hypothetical protein CZ794_13715 [Psychrobacter sp. JB385]|nr:hypothetical protein CZ794_13715 [Psychrobacter sp. JB385]
MKKHVFTLVIYLDKAIAFFLIPAFNFATLHGPVSSKLVYDAKNTDTAAKYIER